MLKACTFDGKNKPLGVLQSAIGISSYKPAITGLQASIGNTSIIENECYEKQNAILTKQRVSPLFWIPLAQSIHLGIEFHTDPFFSRMRIIKLKNSSDALFKRDSTFKARNRLFDFLVAVSFYAETL